MKQFITLFLVLFSFISYSQLTIGVKIGGLALHHKKVSPNYYKWSIDKKGRFVGYAGATITVGYQFNQYLGVKFAQTIMPYDCGGKFSGITHIGIDFFDRIVGFKNETHRFSASFGPLFYYRKNWHKIPDYYAEEGFLKTGKNKDWERKFVWHGGQIQYDYYLNERVSISTNFLPGFPYIYTFNTGLQTSF